MRPDLAAVAVGVFDAQLGRGARLSVLILVPAGHAAIDAERAEVAIPRDQILGAHQGQLSDSLLRHRLQQTSRWLRRCAYERIADWLKRALAEDVALLGQGAKPAVRSHRDTRRDRELRLPADVLRLRTPANRRVAVG